MAGLEVTELTLRDYLAILRRHRGIVLVTFLAVLGAALAYSVLSSPVYESTSAVLVRTSRNQQLFPNVGDSQASSFWRDPGAEFEYVESSGFRERAQARSAQGVNVSASYDDSANSPLNRSGRLEFRARASDPVEARNAAELWAELYLDERAQGETDRTRLALEALDQQRLALEAERDAVLEPIRPIDEALLETTDPNVITRLTTQRLALLQTLDNALLPIEFQLRSLSNDLAALRIVAEFTEVPEVSARLTKSASPARQVSPNVPRNMALGGVLGLLLGVGAALLLDSLRTRITGRDDVETVTPLPVLAEVPDVAVADLVDGTAAATRYGAEVERVVSAVVQQASNFEGAYRVLVTSPGPGDGKSTMAAELGRRISLGRMSTVLVDADLRRPVLHRELGVTHRRAGLAELLGRSQDEQVRLARVADYERLAFLPSGAPTDEAASLLRSGIGSVLDHIAGRHDVVVVDSPPVLLVTDAEVIADTVDGVVVVVRAGRTKRPDLQITLRRLAATRAQVIGIVLVGVQPDDGGDYGYQYSYRADAHRVPGDEAARPRRRLRSVSA